MKSSLLNSTSIGSLVLAGVFFSVPAWAQSQAPVETVTITGSRLQQTTGFTTPTPVTAISPLQYEVKQITNLLDIQNDLPSLTPNQNQSSVVSPGAANFNLRNVGSLRTLTLVNGLRTLPTSIDQQYDINTLPAALVQHIDVVTGGASAGYGSDAVAGIVNVTLNTTLNGFRGNFNVGESYFGDNKSMSGSLAYGSSFAGGRGHFVIGADYDRVEGVLTQSMRPWGRGDWGVATDPNCKTITTTCTNLYITQGVVASSMADGGVITAPTALKGIQFGPGGTVLPFKYGTFAGGSYMVGGDGARDNENSNLQPANGHTNVLGYVSYDLNDDVSIWGQMLFARSTSFVDILPALDSGNITVTNQNAFLPAQIATLMAANKLTSFTLGRSNVDLAPIDFGHDLVNGENEDYNGATGVKGKFDALGTTWSWDLGGQYASNDYRAIVSQNRRNDLWLLSVDSLANPASGGVAGVPVGTPVCRSTLTNPTNGCVPVDLFGKGSITPAVTSYVTGTSYVKAEMRMMDIAANIKGVPFEDWAGPVSMAGGVEYRRQSIHTYTDPFSPAFAWSQANNSPYAGAYDVEEGYFEVDVPLIKGIPLIELIDIDSAVRMTSYSNSGGVTTWKTGLNWSVTDDLRLRGVRSHDIRAPNLQELFQQPLLRCCGTVTNPITQASNSTAFQTSGNPALKPEIGDTISGGVVYTPSWLQDFNISVDYWKIKLTNQIVTASTQNVVNNCLSLSLTDYCNLITFNGAGQITVVKQPTVNAASLSTDGIDVEMGYKFNMEDVWAAWGGQVQLHLLGTYLDSYSTNQFGLYSQNAGTTGTAALPRFKSNLTAIYLNGPWTFSFSGNYFSVGYYNRQYNNPAVSFANGGRTINDNSLPARFYVSLTGSYQWTDTWQFYVRLKNVFNTPPPPTPDTRPFQSAQGSNALFDRFGGQITVGAKISLN